MTADRLSEGIYWALMDSSLSLSHSPGTRSLIWNCITVLLQYFFVFVFVTVVHGVDGEISKGWHEFILLTCLIFFSLRILRFWIFLIGLLKSSRLLGGTPDFSFFTKLSMKEKFTEWRTKRYLFRFCYSFLQLKYNYTANLAP